MASTTLGSGERQSGAITLAAATVDTVTFPRYTGKVRVTNLDGAAAITVVIGNSATTLSSPTVGDKTGYTLPAAVSDIVLGGPKSVSTATQAVAATVVKLISSGTPQYNVEEA